MRAKYILPWKRSRSSDWPKRCEPTRALLLLCSDIAAGISKRLAASSFYHKTAQRFSILFHVVLFEETSSHPLAAIISRRCRTILTRRFHIFYSIFLYFISRDIFWRNFEPSLGSNNLAKTSNIFETSFWYFLRYFSFHFHTFEGTLRRQLLLTTLKFIKP